MLIRKIQKNKKNQIYKKKKKEVEGQTSLTIPFSPQPPTATLIPSPLSSPKTNNPAHRPPPLQAKAFAPPRTIFPSAISTSKNLNQPYFFSSAPSRLLPWPLPSSRYGRSPPPLFCRNEREPPLSLSPIFTLQLVIVQRSPSSTADIVSPPRNRTTIPSPLQLQRPRTTTTIGSSIDRRETNREGRRQRNEIDLKKTKANMKNKGNKY
jgi:hypothetical protein